jgi:hypothetical protein
MTIAGAKASRIVPALVALEGFFRCIPSWELASTCASRRDACP